MADNNSISLEEIPEKLRTRRACVEAVRQNGLQIRFVPEVLMDRQMCLYAVRQNGNALDYIHDHPDIWNKYVDQDMCMEAVKSAGYSLAYVPPEFRSAELCDTAVKQFGGGTRRCA